MLLTGLKMAYKSRIMLNIRQWLKYMPQKPLHGRETRLHHFKWWLIGTLGIFEFTVACGCGNKIRATDGVRRYHYICGKCGKDYRGLKRRVFT